MNQLNPAPVPDLASFNREATDAENPYMGLHPFEESDAPYFFGRVQETSDLFRMVKRGTLTVLFGRSGLGKSSLLRAGLFPRLRAEGFFPVPIRFDYESKEPLADQLWSSIDSETAPRRDEGTGLEKDELVWSWFHRVPLWSERNRLLVPTLVFDQFEETFTLGKNHPQGAEMIAQLADLIENRVPAALRAGELPPGYGTPKLKVILALREDYLAQLEDLRPLIPSLAGNRYRLLGMNGLQALDAVASPAEKIIDRAVAEKVVRFVASAGEGQGATAADISTFEVEPALLSLVCHELNDRRKQKGLSTISEALLSGERSRIIEGFYQRSVGDLAPEVRTFVEDRLLTSDGYRTTVALTAVREVSNVSDQAIETLIRRRILRKEDRFGRPHLELIHDVLTRIVRDSRDKRREETRRAEILARRRMWWVRGGAVAVLFVALIVAGILVLRRNAAKNAEKLAKQNQALEVAHTLEEAGRKALLRGEGGNAAQLLNLGYGFLRDAGARSRDHEMMLSRALMGLRGQVALVEQPPDVGALAYAPGGSLATGGSDGIIRFWDGAKYDEQGAPLKPAAAGVPDVKSDEPIHKRTGTADGHATPVDGIVFLEGRRLASLSAGEVTIWDLAAGNEIARLIPRPSDEAVVSRARFCANGDLLAVWFPGDDRVSTWHLSQVPAWTEPGTAEILRVSDVACLTDGRLLLAGEDGVARIVHDETASGPGPISHFVTDANLPHGAPIVRVGATPDGKVIATGGRDGRAIVWRRQGEGEQFNPKVVGRPAVIDSIAVDRAGESLIIVTGERRTSHPVSQQESTSKGARSDEPPPMSATLWDLASARPVFELGGDHLMARFAPGGKTAVVVSPERLQVWTRADKRWSRSRETTLDGSEVTGLALLDGRAAIASSGGVVRIWELAPPPAVSDVALAWPSVHDAPTPILQIDKTMRTLRTVDLAFIVDDEHLVSFGGGRIDFVDTASDLVVSNHAPDDEVRVATFDRGRKRFAVIGSAGTVLVWDAAQRRILKTIAEAVPINQVALSPDGDSLATGDSRGRVCLWTVVPAKQVACKDLFPGAEVSALAVREERGTILAGDSLGRVALFDARQGGRVTQLDGHLKRVWAVAFSPDGQWAVTSSEDQTAVVWQVEGAVRKATLESPGWLLAVGDTQIVVGGYGPTLVWRKDGKLLHTLPSLGTSALQIGPDGHVLYTIESGIAYGTHLARSWSLDDGSPIDAVTIPDEISTISPSGKLIAAGGGHVELYAAPSAERGLAPRHVGRVSAAAATATSVVTVDDMGSVFLWSPWIDRAPRRLVVAEPAETSPEFSADGQWLAVAEARSAYVISTDGSRKTPLTDGRAMKLAWTGDRAVSVDEALTVAVADVKKLGAPPQVVTTPGHRGAGTRATLDPSAERFAFVNADGAIEVWHGDERLHTLDVGGRTVKHLVLGAPASRLLVALLVDRMLVWRLPEPAGAKIPDPSVYLGAYGAAYLAGDRLVAVSAGHVQAFRLPGGPHPHGTSPDDLQGMQEDKKKETPETTTIDTRARIFPPDLRGRLLLGYEDEAVTVWSIDDGDVVQVLKTGHIDNATFTARGDITTYDTGANDPKTARIVNWRRSGGIWQREDRDVPTAMGILYALSGNKNLLGRNEVEDQNPLRLIQRDHRVGMTLSGPGITWFLIFDSRSDSPAEFIMAPNDQEFAFGDGDRVWSIDEAGKLSEWDLHTTAVRGVLSPSHVLAAGAAGNLVRVVTTRDTAEPDSQLIEVFTVPLDGHPAPPPLAHTVSLRLPLAELSPDLTRLVISGETGSVLLWDLPDDKGGVHEKDNGPVALDGHLGFVYAIAFGGPDGEFATASADGTARIFHRDGKLELTLTGHLAAVNTVSFDPEGHWIATASEDGTARIWNEEGMPLVRLTTDWGAAETIFLPPGKAGGRRILTTDGDGGIRIWDLGWSVRVWRGDEPVELRPDQIDDYLQEMLPSGHQG